LPYWNQVARLAGAVGGTNARIRKSKLRIYSEDEKYEKKTRADLRFDEQLDDVLKKITESGQDSLTDREKKILTLGSQRYRNR